jgi:Family of unknown function (DUF6011)
MNIEQLAVAVSELDDVVRKLPEKDQEFAKSMIEQFNKKGYLSWKQEEWVSRLIEKANKPVPEVESVGSLAGLFNLFVKAKAHLKYPSISLEVDGRPVALKSSLNNKKHGAIVNVTDGRPFGQNVWYGRVNAGGEWTQNSYVKEADLEPVRKLLKAMSDDPAGTAKAYGKLTGRCCFCNKGLTDEKSTAAGFGPVCAKHYGLESEWKKAVGVLEKYENAELEAA